jgi:hypothetical protein
LHPNPNKFLTVLFSFVPGAGHMYLGLMKRGLSLMLGFALSIAGAGFFGGMLNLLEAAFILLIPVTWFIAFFDFWRYPRMTPEEKAQVKDDFLLPDIPKGVKLPNGGISRKARLVAGVLLILAGAYQLFQQFSWLVVEQFFHSERLIKLFGQLPRMVGGAAIVVVGLLLIFWKSRQIKKERQGYAE